MTTHRVVSVAYACLALLLLPSQLVHATEPLGDTINGKSPSFRLTPRPPTAPESLRKKVQELLPIYDARIAQNPTDADAYTRRAAAHCHLEQFDLAVRDAEEAVRLNPRSHEAYTWLGTALAMIGNPEQATVALVRAIELGADKATTLKLLASCREKQGDFNGAIVDLGDAIKSSTEAPIRLVELYQLRAMVYAAKGEIDKAANDYNQAVKVLPNVPAVYELRGKFWLSQEQYSKAVADFEQAVRLDELQGHDYVTFLSVIWDNPDAFRESFPLAKDICNGTDWKNWYALALYADAEFECGRYDQAVQWQTKALNLAPDDLKPRVQRRIAAYQRNSPFVPVIQR